MATKLFVAGLSYALTDDALRALFAEYGTVDSAQIITDRDTNRSKGFGFVEFADDAAAQAAIAGLNGKDMDGRPLTVNIAKPREDRPQRSFNGGGNRGNGGGWNNDRQGSIGNNFRRSHR
ncbi:MAG TPA: RNA-binding protein [Candidatus Saccharimonadales bacterium]|nr:RNA-binding protein [Candidatus Saccharimonadales bacterium]